MSEMINLGEARIHATPSESPFKRLTINRKLRNDDRDDQRQIHRHAIGNDGADGGEVQVGRQEIDDVVKPVEDLPQGDGLANRAGG
jgi:hypothetical protein